MKRGQAEAAGTAALEHGGLELAKWVAIVTMTIDHYGKIVAPDVYAVTHAIGRVSFPLFAATVGLRLALTPRVAARYLDRLIPWAIASQPIYVLAGREWHEGNILFTLALGVAAHETIAGWRAGRRLRASLGLAAALALSPLVEFGPAGVLMVPAVSALGRRDLALAVWVVGPLGLLANLRPPPTLLAPIDAAALFASPVLALSAKRPVALPRLPKHAFYAFYPAHLLVLHWLDRYG